MTKSHHRAGFQTFEIQHYDHAASRTDGVRPTARLAYNATTRTTTVTNALGQASSYVNDAANRLVAATNALGQTTNYGYDAQGNLTEVTDALGRLTTQAYDSRGNRTLTRDAEGRTVSYSYDANNRLVTETRYLVADPDGSGAGEPGTAVTSRYAYDSEGHLRFTVSAEGRVSEYRYNAAGQRIAAITYTAAAYNLTGLNPTTTLSEAQLQTWLGSQDKSQTERVDYSYDFRGQVSTTTTYATVNADGSPVYVTRRYK